MVGDRGMLVEYAKVIDPKLHRHIQKMILVCRRELGREVKEIVTGYRSFMIIFDPLLKDSVLLQKQVRQLTEKTKEQVLPPSKVIEVPVMYGGEWGPDLEYVARHAGLRLQEVIRLHTSVEYRIYMSGFTPGFPLLGGLNPKLYTPRRKTPRTKVPAGSVGIGGHQTGIYPFPSPGGWQLIGRTNVRLFDLDSDPMFEYALGDRIRFRAIKPNEKDDANGP